jgi:ribosome-binding factor A
MESIRQNKISRMLQKELGGMFQSELGHLRGRSMVTVTRVNVTSDLSLARIYLSLFATQDKNALFEKIRENRKEIRHLLAAKVRKQLRSVPELEFFIDDTLDYIEHIDELLKK